MRRLFLIAGLAALALAAAGTAPAATRACGSLTVSGTGTVTSSTGGAAACFLAAFRSCTPASYELARFGVDTVARTSFAILRTSKGCEVTVGTSLTVIPQKPRPSGGGGCSGLVRRRGDVVATGCRGTGLDGTISLTGQSR